MMLIMTLLSLVFLVGTASASDSSPLQDYIDDETGEVKSFDPTEQFSITVENLSRFRADVHWDDGHLGVVITTVDAGESGSLQTFQGHGFFVTRHGVRENLYPEEVEGEEDKPLRFVAQKPNEKMVIPEEASPLYGERARRNRCVDRYTMCKDEGESRMRCVLNHPPLGGRNSRMCVPNLARGSEAPTYQ